MKKWCEFVITAAVVLILVLLSLGLLELPRIYFARSDEQLNGVLSISGYDIDNEIKSMTMAQKMEAFNRDDFLMAEEALVPDEELYERLETSLEEYLSIIFYDEAIYYLSDIIEFIGRGQYRSISYNVIQVEENEIYSMKLGALKMENEDYAIYASMIIIFDLETYDIFALSLGFDGAGFLPYKVGEEVLLELNKYYETDILWEETMSNIDGYFINIMPWDFETYEKTLLRTLMITLQEGDTEITHRYEQ